MSKEKQIIEEMAKVICAVCAKGESPCALAESGRMCDAAWEEAEAFYNADYRKQSDGEWIKHPASYECTACKEEFFVEGYAEDYDPITDWDLHFCPNCGAKMKGGAE